MKRGISIYLSILALAALTAVLYLIDFDESDLLAIAAGVVLATVKAYATFAAHQRGFDQDLAIWYVTRPLMGAVAGLLLIALIRAGLVVVGAQAPTQLSPWAILAFAAAGGWAAKDVFEMLNEIIHTLRGRPPGDPHSKGDVT